MSSSPALARLTALIRRELAADDVRIVEASSPKEEGVLRASLPGDRAVDVVFAAAPADADARLRRLEMLVASFRDTIEQEPLSSHTPSRPPPATSLHEELRALAERAAAVDALVIDARSPVVWAAADDATTEPTVRETGAPPDVVVSLDARREARRGTPSNDRTSGEQRTVPPVEPQPPSAADTAIAAVRALSVLPQLHRGGHLHHAVRAQDFGYVARSFAAIYVLIVVYEAPFDELRAERAIQHALPAIERLVLALPPLDPTPMAGAMAIRRGRRR